MHLHVTRSEEFRLMAVKQYNFGHLQKMVELAEDKIPLFWYRSTENGGLCRLHIIFYESPLFWAMCFR